MREILEAIAAGTLDIDEALRRLGATEDIGFARIDHDRPRRCGFPEVVFAQNKTPEQCLEIARRIHARAGVVLLTRVPEQTQELFAREWPQARSNPLARTIIAGDPQTRRIAVEHSVLVISAGTSDQGVAQEAAETARVMGCTVREINDCGVAGLHRLLENAQALREADVIIVVAGMEGALPSVVGGLTDCPLLAVPTSVGYGGSFGGLAALLGMLNSCASGVSVLNIDNGFGAGCAAARIIKGLQKRSGDGC